MNSYEYISLKMELLRFTYDFYKKTQMISQISGPNYIQSKKLYNLV